MQKKLKYSIIIIIGLIAVLVGILFIKKYNYDKTIKKQMESAVHAITISENTELFAKPNSKKKLKNLEVGSNVYVLENILDNEGRSWSKVNSDDTIGYVLSEEIDNFTEANMKKELMLDVSKFNLQNNFKNIGEFKLFIIENNIKYVYIRAGGRGYGEAGNFYTDQNYKEYSEACEYLGVPFGYYFLDEAIVSSEVDEEVEFINNFISENQYKYNTLPVALDIEKHAEKGRADGIWDTRYLLVNELVQKLENTGNNVILYSNANIANKYLTNVKAKMWLAYYPELDEIPNYWYSDTSAEGATNSVLISKLVAWQFTETGVKNKINTNVDISIVYNCFFSKKTMNDIYNDITGKSESVKKIFKLKNKVEYKNIFSFSNVNNI